VGGGQLVGHVGGQGPELLMVHGGPYSEDLEPLAEEFRATHRVATYQQRGLAPSTTQGPLVVDQHRADLVSVLEALGWSHPVVLGHSWGGHLVLNLLAHHAERVGAAVLVEALGAVGDGGYAEFATELQRRTPPADWERAEATEDTLESFRLVWPSYFPSRDGAPEVGARRVDRELLEVGMQSVFDQIGDLEARLAGSAVPTVVVAGDASPVPLSAATDTAQLVGAEVVVVPGAGHYPWLDVPGGCLRPAVDAATERRRAPGPEE